ncbi:MAG TPA: RDD family protein [Bryobacteraceae bacterium]|nr:RDD family protein [Bryobacteraceae bacterium]
MTPVYTAASAAAPELHYEATDAVTSRSVATAAAPAAPARRTLTYQRPLFSSRELPRVVIETIAPDLPSAPPRKAASPHRPRPRKVIAGQQNLEFSGAAAKAGESVIYCDAPVAIPAHRAMGAALDGSLIVIALAVFGLVFHFLGGAFVLNRQTLPMFAGVIAGVVVFYRLLWCLANGDTAGQRWARLRLVDFDGRAPNRAQRFYRTVSGFLSLGAAGIGLLWALVDEETLTWHDHISKTFPTPAD